jgi:phosphate transport system substrate-binding protein
MKQKKTRLSLLLLACCSITVSSQEADNNEPVRITQDVMLYEYVPFGNGTKAVSLNKESTFKLSVNLPRLDGATALYPVYAAFVQAVYPFDDYSFSAQHIIQCNQTHRAYENLINGTVDIIFCAEPSKEQIERAAEKGLKFRMTPIGKDAFVFFVNTNNEMSNITSSQIKDIYSGAVVNWKDVEGQDVSIIPYQRPKDSGSQTILETIMGDTPILEPLKENVVGGMGGMIEQVAAYKNYHNAIGYSFLYFSTEMTRNNEIKLLSIDGVFPSKKTIQTDEYPFSGTFYAITNGNEDDNTKKFLEWILSEQGQYLIEKTGYVPLR